MQATRNREAAAQQRLPAGRHGLSREEVVASQRGRILRAMATTMAEKGYARTTVADVLAVAGVSRETFYEQFANKEACFMAAYEEAVGILLERVPGASAEGTPLERFDTLIGAYLDALASEPDFARLFLVEIYGAGPTALSRRADAQAGFVALLERMLKPRDATERFALQALVAAVGALVTARLAVGDIDGLRGLRKPIVGLVKRALEKDVLHG